MLCGDKIDIKVKAFCRSQKLKTQLSYLNEKFTEVVSRLVPRY